MSLWILGLWHWFRSNKFNDFDNNLKYMVDIFPDGFVYFLDLKISESAIDVFRKSSHTGQYTHFSSFEPWGRKTAWIKALFVRAKKISTNSIPIILTTRFLELIPLCRGTAFLLPYEKHSSISSKGNNFRIQILFSNQPMTVYQKFDFAYHI